MSLYELYRCIREDGTSKDWAVRINPDGSITTRWGRTGKKLINIQTREVALQALKRSKSKKGYSWIGIYEIDVLGQLKEIGHCDSGHIVQPSTLSIHWQLALGIEANGRELNAWRQSVLLSLHDCGIRLDDKTLPDSEVSGLGLIICEEVTLLLGLILMKHRTPAGVRFTLRTTDHYENHSNLQGSFHLLERLGTDLPAIRPLAESLGLLAPKIDLQLAIVTDRHCWF